MNIVNLIIAIAQAIPAVERILQLLFKTYAERRIDRMSNDDIEAIKKSFSMRDQRPIEEILNPENAGKPSGVSGSQIVDKLPLIFLMLTLSGCITRGKIEAMIWLNNGIDQEICKREPKLNEYGFYRKLSDKTCEDAGHPKGCIEFVSYCNPIIKDFAEIHRSDLVKIMNQTLPKKP